MRSSILLLALGPLLTACVNTDASVFVEAHLINPQATVTAQPLGTTLQGQALLAMHLGARASGDSKVTLGAFSIVSGDQTMTLVATLPVMPNAAQPFAVATDSDVDVLLTFDSGATLLPVQAKTDLCAGPLVIKGTIQDSLEPAQTPMATAGFSAMCQ